MTTHRRTCASPRPMMRASCVGAIGLTLVELLIATALASLAAAALGGLLVATLAARRRAAAHADVVTEVAAAVDQIVRDVRLAGYDPLQRGITALPAAAATSVVIAADLDGNGSVDSASEEQVGYRLGTDNSLQRTVGRQSLPILADVAANGLLFHYLDAQGGELVPPAVDGALAIVVELTVRATPTHGAIAMRGGARLLNR